MLRKAVRPCLALQFRRVLSGDDASDGGQDEHVAWQPQQLLRGRWRPCRQPPGLFVQQLRPGRTWEQCWLALADRCKTARLCSPDNRMTNIHTEQNAGAIDMNDLASQAARQHTAREGPQVAAKGRLCFDVVPQRGHIQPVLIDDSARAIRDTNHCAGGRPGVRQMLCRPHISNSAGNERAAVSRAVSWHTGASHGITSALGISDMDCKSQEGTYFAPW